MSAGSRSTQGRGRGARGIAAGAWFYGPQGFGNTTGNAPSAPRAELCGQDSAKADREPLIWEEFLFASCPGPAGTWPCALPFGHDGEHARFVEAEAVAAHDYAAENAALRALLLTAGQLLRGVRPYGNPGHSFRQDVCDRIEKAVR